MEKDQIVELIQKRIDYVIDQIIFWNKQTTENDALFRSRYMAIYCELMSIMDQINAKERDNDSKIN